MQFIVIANPETRRVKLFQEALKNCGLSPAKLVPYLDLLTQKCYLAEFDSPNTIFRFEAPERNFAVNRGFIAAGAEIEPNGQHQKISAIKAAHLPEDLGRIWYQHQWYLGWRKCLKTWTVNLQGRILNHPNEIIIMFDKVQCQKLLATAGVPIPPILTDNIIDSYNRLRIEMEAQKTTRVFVKLAHGSSASGVVAYQIQDKFERAITTVERVVIDGGSRFYNSRLIRQYLNQSVVSDLINFLAGESIQVEKWLPKARLNAKEFDVRVVIIGGKARQAVIRVGNSPMTNLHLGSERREITDLPSGLSSQTWAEMLSTCERAAACFPHSFYCGIDLLIAPNLKDHYILEINAFGDLVQGITWQGLDTYTTEVKMLLEEY